MAHVTELSCARKDDSDEESDMNYINNEGFKQVNLRHK